MTRFTRPVILQKWRGFSLRFPRTYGGAAAMGLVAGTVFALLNPPALTKNDTGLRDPSSLGAGRTPQSSCPAVDNAISRLPFQILPNGHGSLKVMSFNVGNMNLKVEWHGIIPKTVPVCPNYRLCKPEVARAIREYVRLQAPDVILFQATLGASQLLGADQGGPALDANLYDARCPANAPNGKDTGRGQICVAWRKDRISSVENCREITDGKSGAVRCDLAVETDAGAQVVQFVSAHLSAEDPGSRARVSEQLFVNLLESNLPAVVGGDFNDSKCTFGCRCDAPYPVEFGTLFGAHYKNFGRWNPPSTFYGHLHANIAPATHASHLLGGSYDHLFANFGVPRPLDLAPHCGGAAACLGGADGFPKPDVGDHLDHFPIVAQFAW